MVLEELIPLDISLSPIHLRAFLNLLVSPLSSVSPLPEPPHAPYYCCWGLLMPPSDTVPLPKPSCSADRSACARGPGHVEMTRDNVRKGWLISFPI